MGSSVLSYASQDHFRCRDEASLNPGLGGFQGQGAGDVGLADARRTEQRHVLLTLDEGEAAELGDLFARCLARKAKVKALE